LAEGTARAALAAVALPLSIGRSVGGQVIAGARGVSEQKLAWADSAVIRLVQESSLQESIRAEVLRQAEQRTSHKIALVKKPFPAGEEQEFSRMSCVMAGTLAWVPEGQSRQYYLRSQGIDTALEIQLLYPALNSEGTKPNDITNPPMALSMEVRTSLIRVQDNEPLYSFAMKYQGPGRKFAAWAANDAASLREELQHCYQAVAAAIIDQLGVQAWPLEAQPALAGE